MNSLQVTATIVLLSAALALAEAPTTAPAEPAPSAAELETARRRMQLRRESFKALGASGADEELERAIRRLEMVRLKPRKADVPEPKAAATTQPSSATQPAPRGRQVEVAVLSGTATTQPVAKAKLSPLDKIKSLPASSIADPVALADALCLAGRLEAAATFYEKAMDTKVDSATRAWLLFQLGNCHKGSDPQAARGYYKRLLSEHPDSIWKAAAVVADRLIEWKLTNEPEKLLKAAAKMVEKVEKP